VLQKAEFSDEYKTVGKILKNLPEKIITKM
jgi:hypothetical protein